MRAALHFSLFYPRDAWRRWIVPLMAVALAFPGHVAAANGDLVGETLFERACDSGLGVGVAFDGSSLWYSCAGQSPDLFRADSRTGALLGSYDIAGGLGALAWDEGRQRLWAAAGQGIGQTGGEVYAIDPSTGESTVQFVLADEFCDLVDGLAYDAGDDSLYFSSDCYAQTIRHVSALDGRPFADDGFLWGGDGCYNSGLAIGGDLLYQGSNGCIHIWVVDKRSKLAAFDFDSPGIRDEDMECDPRSFRPKTVMWSKDAYNDTAYAFEIPLGSCNFGGKPTPERRDRDVVFIRGIDSVGSCDAANEWLPQYLQSSEGQSYFGYTKIGQYLNFSYRDGAAYTCDAGDAYSPIDTCDGVAQAAEELKQLVDTAASSKVSVVAHSMGGLVTAYLAATQPEWAKQHIASAITFDSPLRGVPPLARKQAKNSPWGTACQDSQSITDLFDDSDGSIVARAAGAARVVPFYPLDASDFLVVPHDRTTLEGARPFNVINACAYALPSEAGTCEPPKIVDDDHSSIWANPEDRQGLSKAFLAGCAINVMLSCSFLSAPVNRDATTPLHANVPNGVGRIRFTSNFGSVVRMALFAPNGTQYGPDGAGPGLAYGLTETSETYVVDSPPPGEWRLELTGLDVAPDGESVGIVVGIEQLADDEDPCTIDSCDGSTGECSHILVTGLAAVSCRLSSLEMLLVSPAATALKKRLVRRLQAHIAQSRLHISALEGSAIDEADLRARSIRQLRRRLGAFERLVSKSLRKRPPAIGVLTVMLHTVRSAREAVTAGSG